MAHFVAKKLHLRPNDILDTWGVPELLVAYGHYANEESNQHFHEWRSLDPQTRAKTPQPKQFAVLFHSYDDMEED